MGIRILEMLGGRGDMAKKRLRTTRVKAGTSSNPHYKLRGSAKKGRSSINYVDYLMNEQKTF